MMTTYQALSLMIAFGSLIVLMMNTKKITALLTPERLRLLSVAIDSFG